MYAVCSHKNRLIEALLLSIHNIPFSKEITLNYSKFAAMGFFSKALKNEFETAVVNEPSVFESLKLSCTCCFVTLHGINGHI